MRQVQEALKDIGIPVIAGIWRATSENQNPPLQYVVYSSTTTETAFQDEKWIISTLGEYSFKKTYLGLKASIAKGVSG